MTTAYIKDVGIYDITMNNPSYTHRLSHLSCQLKAKY